MSKKMSRYPSERKVYVGDLGSNARKDDIEYAFSEYGPICSVWVARNPPGFAFVEFEDARDAADAVRQLSGRSLFGRRIRVELSTGKTVGRRNDRNKRNGRYDEGNLEEKCFDCGVRGHYARECRRYVRARRRNDEANNRRSPSASRGRRTPSPRATRSRSRSGSRHRNSISTTHTRRERHGERRKKETRQSRERDLKRSRERESRYSDEEKKHEYRKNGRRPPSPDAPKKRGYGSRSPSVNNSSDSRSGSDSDESSRRGGDDSSVSYSPRSNSRKN